MHKKADYNHLTAVYHIWLSHSDYHTAVYYREAADYLVIT